MGGLRADCRSGFPRSSLCGQRSSVIPVPPVCCLGPAAAAMLWMLGGDCEAFLVAGLTICTPPARPRGGPLQRVGSRYEVECLGDHQNPVYNPQ